MKYQRLFGVLFALLGLPALVLAQGNPKGIEFFENKIRPVLAKYCYECHSAQSKKLKADLLLDSKEGMLRGGVNGPVFVSGKAKDSLLIKALNHDGPTRMPSQSTKLPADVIADFVKWIDMGAPDPREGKALAKRTIDIEKGRQHWAFQPLAPGALPSVKNASWGKTPVDRYILAQLEAKGLTPNGPIAAERLIRRAYFDLLGLPPSPMEIDVFLKDAAGAKRGEAYAAMIDRLLDSPHFGERWARHWLDTVRFAESGGYEFDGNRPNAYHYRDFVIKAFNQDMPFDQFLRLQVAGDHLAPADLNAISATGFLVAGSYPGQTTSKTLALIRYDHLDDMISTLGTSMLGLSLGCARCHEHKYDPIPQEDYYRLLANLSRTDSANIKVNLDPQAFAKEKAEFDRAHVPLLKQRDEFEQSELAKRLQAWVSGQKATASPWLILDTIDAKNKKSTLVKQPDGSLLAADKAEKNDTLTIVAQTMQTGIKAIRIEALTDKSLPKGGPGRSPQGTFTLTEMSLTATPLDPNVKAEPIKVKLKAGAVSFEDSAFPLADALDGDRTTGWSVGKELGKNHAAILNLDGVVGFEGGTVLTLKLLFHDEHFAIGRPRISISTASPELNAQAELQHAAELRVVKQIAPHQREPIGRWLRKFDKPTDAVYTAVEAHAKKEPKAKLVDVFAATGNKGGDVNFLIRGEVDRKREVAKAGFVQVLMKNQDQHWLSKTSPKEPRIALANWLTDADNGAGHLVARVIVNRLWQHHMGRGIVGTPNDFGAQGDAPTHPELLDYLASELIKNGWRLKPIHKLIMTSAVYMQSNEVNAISLKADPQNRLWWRHPTRRLEAEAIRDNILAVGGGIDTKMFGPGTLDGNSARRSVYLTVKRSQMIPLLQMFDVPEALQSIGERSVTTVPTQSLAFMNSPFVRGAAQKLAMRVRSQPDPIEQAYLIALARRPSANERERMDSFIARQAASYGSTPQARDQALVDFCQVLLCLNEFIYVD